MELYGVCHCVMQVWRYFSFLPFLLFQNMFIPPLNDFYHAYSGGIFLGRCVFFRRKCDGLFSYISFSCVSIFSVLFFDAI